MKIPFWEESYKDDNISTFGVEPNPTIIEYENMITKTACILDVGCGDGKNSLYLSKQGHLNIDAFDLSENAIAKLNRIAANRKLKVSAWVQDLCKYNFDKKYDLIFSFGTLHFVSKTHWKSFLLDAKESTNIGGLHIIQLFTNEVPPSPDIEPFAIGLSDDEEIKYLYEDWNILQFNSYTFEDEHPGVPKHVHASNKIVAQRIN